MWCPSAVRTFIEIDQFRTYTPWITSVVVLAFVFGDLLGLAGTDGPDPLARSRIEYFPPGNTAACHLPGIRQAYDSFGHRHRSIPPANEQAGSACGTRPLRARLYQSHDLGPALHQAVAGKRFGSRFLRSHRVQRRQRSSRTISILCSSSETRFLPLSASAFLPHPGNGQCNSITSCAAAPSRHRGGVFRRCRLLRTGAGVAWRGRMSGAGRFRTARRSRERRGGRESGRAGVLDSTPRPRPRSTRRARTIRDRKPGIGGNVTASPLHARPGDYHPASLHGARTRMHMLQAKKRCPGE